MAEPPIKVSSSPSLFASLAIDTVKRRLLISSGNQGTLTVASLLQPKVHHMVRVGDSTGISVDSEDGEYFVGTVTGVTVVDQNSLRRLNFIPMNGAVVAQEFDPKNDRLYVAVANDSKLRVINAHSDRIVDQIEVGGVPSGMAMDSHYHWMFLTIKSRDKVAAVDLEKNVPSKTWFTPPGFAPRQLAYASALNSFYVTGAEPFLLQLSLLSGEKPRKINLGNSELRDIAYDSSFDRLYVRIPAKVLAVVASGRLKGQIVGTVEIPKSARSIAVDPRTHKVWTVFVSKNESYIQAYDPNIKVR